MPNAVDVSAADQQTAISQRYRAAAHVGRDERCGDRRAVR
jgi:hypothetical protein